MNRVVPESVTILLLKSTDTGREIPVVLETLHHFEIISKLRSTYHDFYNKEAPYNDEAQTITMELKELHMWQIIEVIREYAGRIVSPDEFPTEEEESEHLFYLITNPPKVGDPDSDEPPF